MARPKTGQTPVKTFRPPEPLWNEVMKHVEAEKRPYADVLIEALHDWLKKKDRQRAAEERPVGGEETSVPPCQSPTCDMNLSACICGNPHGEEKNA